MKVFIVASILSLILSSMAPFLQTSHASSTSFNGESKITTKNGNQTEEFYDELGNKTEIEYVESQNELRVNTYVNGLLTDYSIRSINQDFETTEIVSYILEEPTLVTTSTMGQDELNIKETIVYKLDEFITITEEEKVSDIDTSSFWGKWVRSLNQGGIIGHLYKDSVTQKTTVYYFSFAKDALLSAVASAISYVWSSYIVAIATLLTSLAISYASGKLRESFNGRYNAYHYVDNYTVVVKDRAVYRHQNQKYDVIYYNSRNGKKNTRVKRLSNWLTEYDILVKGIQRYQYGG